MLVGMSARLLESRKQIYRNSSADYDAMMASAPVCARARDNAAALKTQHAQDVRHQRAVHAGYVQQLEDAEQGELH